MTPTQTVETLCAALLAQVATLCMLARVRPEKAPEARAEIRRIQAELAKLSR